MANITTASAVSAVPNKQTQQSGHPRPTASIPAAHNDWQVPSRYEIRHMIGQGSYGHVCEAFDRQEKRVVAIKKIHRVFEDLVDGKRILREIALLNRLHHDNVVKILDMPVPHNLQKFDEIYIVLEIADSDFKKLFCTPVYLSELHIKTLLYNLLIGLKYVNSVGIYHRDLKPANVLVNQDCSVKICDFGLARTVSKPGSTPNLPSSPRETTNDVFTVPHTQAMKNRLTAHVVTRWYRAPELILLQENYNESIDMWSAGCIFAELMNMIKGNCVHSADRGPLFPGGSCYPLSPDHRHAKDYRYHTRGNRDQLKIIFDVLGTPSTEDIESLEKEDAKRYVKLFPTTEGKKMSEKFPGSSSLAVDLLKKMLIFNPKKRITISEALNHQFFKEIRTPNLEVVGPAKVGVPWDDWVSMDENQLRFACLAECQKFHPELVIPEYLTKSGYGSSTASSMASLK